MQNSTEGKTILDELSQYYSTIKYSKVNPSVIDKTRRVLTDFLAVYGLGLQQSDLFSQAYPLFRKIGGKPESTVIGIQGKAKLPAIYSSLIMAVASHSVELDDGHRWGTSHPSVSVIPATLAMAERVGATFQDILVAIAIGYDVMLRVARSINPLHLNMGFHSTGTCGSLGSAAACAYLNSFDAERFAYSVSIGGLQSAGLVEMLHDHPAIKTLQPGKAASAGILACDLVSMGVSSCRSLFEGQHGWLLAFAKGEYRKGDILEDLGKRWEIQNSYTKFYPTCRHCHATIDLIRKAVREKGLCERDIQNLEVQLYRIAIKEVGEIVHPSNFEEAMFSLPFSIALALRYGNVLPSHYVESNFDDEDLQFLAGKVRIFENQEMNNKYPEERGSVVTLQLRNGEVWKGDIPVAKGEPDNPASDEELLEKHRMILKDRVPLNFVDDLWEIVIRKPVEQVSLDQVIQLFDRAGVEFLE